MSTVCYSEKPFSGNYLRFNMFSLKKKRNYEYSENTVSCPFLKAPWFSEMYMLFMGPTYLYLVNLFVFSIFVNKD